MSTQSPSTSTSKTSFEKALPIAGIIGITAGAMLASGCASAAASFMSLGSVSSVSGSSASSAARNHNHHSAYYIDVREATAAAFIAQVSSSEVFRSISRSAAQHGISDWEAEQGSYVALGEGLRLAGIDDNAAQSWIVRLSHGNAKTADLILQGYQNS